MVPQLSQILANVAVLGLSFSSLAHGLVKRDARPELRGKHSIEKRDGVDHNIFEHEATGATLDFVKNSGVCETTPGVNQYSGYVSTGNNQSTWFWFFESRNNPNKAPLALWLNGGPGCSSMIGLFQENGPCTFNDNTTTPTLNKYSWNEYANLLYVDEPSGSGFSYGPGIVNSTVTAAPYVWNLLQAFFAHFPQYETRDFGLFTESYGGHYGPGFAYYFESQNKAIDSGDIDGQKINLVALGINNGWYDASIQEIEYVSFSANNTYYPLINSSVASDYKADLTDNCLPALAKCTDVSGLQPECLAARKACDDIDGKFSANFPTNYDPYDIRQPGSAPFPPETYLNYLQDPKIVKAIGARSNYSECSDPAGNLFGLTADSQRSFIPELSDLVASGLPTVIWAGDADSVCDWFGGYASVNNISYQHTEEFQNKDLANYTVNGASGGLYKSVGQLNWIRVYASGHQIPSFQPELAFQVFKQLLSKGTVWGT